MSSTRCCTGTGLKKWRPSTFSGRSVAIAELHDRDRRRVRREDRRRGPRRSCRGCANTSSFSCSDSMIASIASWRSAKSPRSVVKPMRVDGRRRARRRRACPSARRGPATPRASRARRRGTSGSCRTRARGIPSARDTSAIPIPMSPAPTTPTRSMSTFAILCVMGALSDPRADRGPQCTDRATRRRPERPRYRSAGPHRRRRPVLASASSTIPRTSSESGVRGVRAAPRTPRGAPGGPPIAADAARRRRARRSRPSSSTGGRHEPGRGELEHRLEVARRRPPRPARSALFTTNTSPISSRPALAACTRRPSRGSRRRPWCRRRPATSTSTWPTPTVSTRTGSKPAASSTRTACGVARASPPRWPRAPSTGRTRRGRSSCSLHADAVAEDRAAAERARRDRPRAPRPRAPVDRRARRRARR